ncbi:uncharacterized protein LOC107264382 isoform X2 [Cephus cinctus]|nr:uncharacterized protein LOC107264382 isoform X2 [Cephus cinctus]XP_024937443.1 uncharacterized protein LOC107264382 isoform X2 [Cephus cinctus]XP_024937444.1 uncharacterized protein LOC107264382 isoform X2 [Cephus cinctus]
MKLFTGIELITGETVSKEDDLSTVFCEGCCNKVEEYINFRIKLITSLEMLHISKGTCENDSKGSISLETNNENKETTMSLIKKNEDEKLSDETSTAMFEEESSDKSERQEERSISEDLINVDENSVPLDFMSLFNIIVQENCLDGNDEDNQINNILNELDCSNEILESHNAKETTVKVKDNDIESEIDVCSCEDDDIIELEVPRKAYETVYIESSSDSDIEICDYEPTGKKSKNHSTLSPLF